jgi:hypothetical protein
MIGFIKNLISGILDFFIGLLGGKKSQQKQIEQKQQPAELPGKVTGKTRRRSGFYLELEESEDNKSTQAQPPATQNGAKATAEPVKAAQPAKAEPAKTPEPAKIELVQTAQGVKAELAKPNKAATNGMVENQGEKTFAPKYLNPSSSTSNGRRRPGANMNSFLDMARQVKTPG